MTVRYELRERRRLAEYEGKLDLITVQSHYADGRVHETTEPVWCDGDSVAVLPFDRKAGTVLLVRQLRPAVFVRGDGLILEACAGHVEESDASIENACRREAREELGIGLPDVKQVATVYINPSSADEKAHLFLASYISGQQRPEMRQMDEDEDIEVVELPISDLIVMRDNGTIRCPRLLMLLQALMLDL